MSMSKNIKISGKILARYNEIISDDALQLIQEIHEKFNNKRLELLNERKNRQKERKRMRDTGTAFQFKNKRSFHPIKPGERKKYKISKKGISEI